MGDRERTAHTTCDFTTQYETTPAGPYRNRVCTALTTCNYDTHWRSSDKTNTSDRVCGVCPDGTFKAHVGHALQCAPFPTGMVSRPHRRQCKVAFCSHIFCRREEHTCLFGRTQKFRGYPQFKNFHALHREECDGRVWDSIRVFHDAVETNCRHGHRCGMGIVSGNSAKCECEPNPKPIPVPQIRNLTSV